MTANNIKIHVQTVHEELGKFKCDNASNFSPTNKPLTNISKLFMLDIGIIINVNSVIKVSVNRVMSSFTFSTFMKDSEISNVTSVVNRLGKNSH